MPGVTDVIQDEVAVGELLWCFPVREVEEPATKDFVAAQVNDVRVDIAGVRTDIAELGSRLTAQMAAMQRTMIRWTLGTMVGLVGLVLAMGFLRGP